jgi:hypothetical protein
VTWQLANAKVWDGSQWVAAVGGAKPWWETVGHKVGNFASVTVTASATPHSKGAWTELVASTSIDSDLTYLAASVSASAQDSATLIDLGTGAAGAESAFVSNLAIGSWSSYRVLIPYRIPSGTRIAARTQSVVTSKSVTVQIQAIDSGSYADAPTTLTVIGTDTATSTGTGTTNNTWVQVVASTAAAYSAIVLVPSASSGNISAANVRVELGIGAAGAETSVGSLVINTSAVEAVLATYNALSIISGTFPAGSRLSVRVDGQGGNVDACLIGIP